MSDSDPDDYMSSKFLTEPPPEPSHSLTYAERRRRKQLLNKSYNKPRRELENDYREQALAKRIDTEENESPGLKLLKKMGYEQGKGLGNSGRTEPIKFELKQDKLGLGMATEIKHKAQAELAKVAKRAKFEEDSFRERVRQENLEKRVEGQLRKLQNICETLDTKHGIEDNIYWQHEETADNEIKNNNNDEILFEEQVVEDDEGEKVQFQKERQEFEDLKPSEKLDRIFRYLRETYYYCFWCGCEYGSAEEIDQECPGYEEEDHD
ncbi:unnamed protein product [Rhizophagus irregularis]|uniref:G-patch domain-containing protein n=4 Tax=Rhizophagus irregularis TaxID=588596 RepID=A0A2N0S124_9GLOM|nr:hypothetical protein GLOIN_2v1788184 [Rhizophagus irregularis DAOM 181602=DAOM 197198]EXX60594.1 hypothetical protein RirG_178520 [Rhizophagus irregularis DAOM 197198w]PKC69252.1 hypothetical protein RhiirA1_392262 [Rhizophagus irregularis]PKK67081.1 hypothetical protein RhiirC2_783983 [Rhizophagus irregularis]POG60207.1 hypothetical protein GLOIN_2v1788184 [Rhizophagus irregularis DAOM 181602=DAOM 197198]UZO28349.1 hypothetical protein OCT59_021877 [Rhizophagus irregularis]|eukprot:XP_025167073.1 hypothetical protein GLOIN_2v1788184 [Rhizophagus irregularis DAOM 181602=DAOM 197198]